MRIHAAPLLAPGRILVLENVVVVIDGRLADLVPDHGEDGADYDVYLHPNVPEPGVSSAAAPIFDHSGRVVTSVNVMGPSAAFDAEPSRSQEIRSVLSQAALSISEKLGYRHVYQRAELDEVALP